MSTISITAGQRNINPVFSRATVAPEAQVRTRLRMTQRGRRLLTFVIALPIAVTLGFAVVNGGSALASKFDTTTPASFETVTVMSGDTLWSVAERVAPNEDPRDVVGAIKSLNALPSSQLMPGQSLAIPSKYSK